MVVIGVGTGGTLTGVAEGLRAHKPSIEVIAVEPASCAVLSGGRPGPHRIEGLGAGFVPDTLKIDLIDAVVPVTDEDAIATAIRIMERRVSRSVSAVAQWPGLHCKRPTKNKIAAKSSSPSSPVPPNATSKPSSLTTSETTRIRS